MFRKEIVAFDLETTGIDIQKSRILSIAISVLDIELNTIEEFYTLVCPNKNPNLYEIELPALNVHGITKEMVQDAPTIGDLIPKIKELFADRDILTHNGNNFDIEFLNNEMARVGEYLPVKGRICYDSCELERTYHSNTLSDTYKRLVGTTMEEDGLFAHNALSDVKATIEIFKRQSKIYDKLDLDKFFMETPKRFIKLVDGKYVFAVGKYKERDVIEIMEKDTSYIKWVLDSNRGQIEFLTLLKQIYIDYKQNKDK